jgi:murein DD-endopeptidase MepM/ murein hydrolase activator NlpD
MKRSEKRSDLGLGIAAGVIGAIIMWGCLAILSYPIERELEIMRIEDIDPFWFEGQQALKEMEERRLAALKYVFPIHPEDFLLDNVKGAFTSPYGERDLEEIGGEGQGFHVGLDLWGISDVVTWQARVVPIDDGIVLNHYFNDPIKGEYYEILHEDGSISEYDHLSKGYLTERIFVDGKWIPTPVKKGVTVIGRIGNSGEWNGNPYKTHLHFALRRPDPETGELRYVNPLKYIDISHLTE